MSEENQLPFPLANSEAQTLKEDLIAHLQQEPMDPAAQEMLLSVQQLQDLTGVQPSADFEANLRQKISRLPPRKPLWQSKAVWSTSIAAAVLLTLFLLRPVSIQPESIQADPISQNLLTLNQSAFQDELMQIHLPLVKSEVDLSPETLKYPSDQIHRTPSLAL